ncbi:somatostatin-1A [Oryzias melastigma]|uniref:somatostatin-1A n=1 Tax=Oryzias melastigma TaxID=30732 RepID=UPI000CF80009|nr:somatostatin-1A [Oryzias melastigma]
MLGSQVQMLLAALALSLLAACVSGAPQRNSPSQTKHLQLLKSEDPTCLLLLKLVLELVALRGEEMLQELEEEELGGRKRPVRRRHVRFTQRERKAGCRNFFWKTFTSC